MVGMYLLLYLPGTMVGIYPGGAYAFLPTMVVYMSPYLPTMVYTLGYTRIHRWSTSMYTVECRTSGCAEREPWALI